jgi:hypothetical protein
VQEFDDRRARVREIVVAGLATQGGFSAGPVKPPPAVPRTPPPGFELVGAHMTSTFALIRYRAAARRPVPLSVGKLAGLALVPGASALLVQRP